MLLLGAGHDVAFDSAGWDLHPLTDLGVKGEGSVLESEQGCGDALTDRSVSLSPGLEQCLLHRVRDHADQRHPGQGEGTGAVWSQQSEEPGLPSLGDQEEEASGLGAWDTHRGNRGQASAWWAS